MLKRVWNWMCRRPVLLSVVLAVSSWSLFPIVRSGYLADDIPNSQRSAWLQEVHESVWAYTLRLTRQWMTNEGRFFPVSVLENTFLFHTVHSRLLYKSLQLTSILLVAIVLATLVKLTIKSDSFFPELCALLFLGIVQIRTWYDPSIAFGLLLPSVTLKVLGAFALVSLGLRTQRRAILWSSLVGASLLWLAALWQYEVVLLLGWIPVGLITIQRVRDLRKSVAACSSIAVPSLVALGISRLVRSGVVASPAYETNLKLATVWRALKFQLGGAFPFATTHPVIDGRPGITDSLRLVSVPGIGAIAILIVLTFLVIWKLATLSSVERLVMIAVGLSFWILPSIPTSTSVRWQQELGPGKSYLPVFFGYIGMGVLAAVGIEIVISVFRARVRGNSLLILVTAIFAIGVTMSFVTNHAGMNHVVNTYAGFRDDRDLFEESIRHGLFEGVPDGSVIVSNAADPNSWVNGVYTKWLGGPRNLVFVTPEQAKTCPSENATWCAVPQHFVLHQDGNGRKSVLVLVRTSDPVFEKFSWTSANSVMIYGSPRPVLHCEASTRISARRIVDRCPISHSLSTSIQIPE